MKISDDNLIEVLLYCSWALLGILTVAGFIFGSTPFAVGILVGGLVAIGNFYWLRTIVERALQLSATSARRFALVKYVLRLALIAITAYLLIVIFQISVIGLVVGLSVLVIAIIAASIYLLVLKGG